MKTVVIKKYDNGPWAYIDAEKLRAEGIECEVIGDTSLSCLMSGTIQIVVLEDMADRAREILEI